MHLPSTTSTQDPCWWSVAPYDPPDAGLFYVRWWATDSKQPVEFKFESRANAVAHIKGLYRDAPYARIELLEALEWGTRTRNKAE